MKQETKDWLENKWWAVRDWIKAHPWPVACVVCFVAGFVVGKL